MVVTRVSPVSLLPHKMKSCYKRNDCDPEWCDDDTHFTSLHAMLEDLGNRWLTCSFAVNGSFYWSAPRRHYTTHPRLSSPVERFPRSDSRLISAGDKKGEEKLLCCSDHLCTAVVLYRIFSNSSFCPNSRSGERTGKREEIEPMPPEVWLPVSFWGKVFAVLYLY